MNKLDASAAQPDAATISNQTELATPVDRPRLDATIDEAAAALKRQQKPDRHFVFPLEADATIPAEYILLGHFLGDSNAETDAKLATYLRRIQNDDGGWPLFIDGDADVSASVKAYYALKLCGDAPDAPHMCRARERILALGGAARANVFTRTTLALFGQIPWRAVPAMPVEIMLLPRWFPFHLSKVSYWSRTVMVPLFILMSLRPRAANPKNIGIAELFVRPPEAERHYLVNPTGSWLGHAFLMLDKALHAATPLMPARARKRAIDRALAFMTPRMNGEHGLGGIFPAMANAVMAFAALGVERDSPLFRDALKAIDNMLVFENGEGYCQPCLSPVWDTALALHALLETGESADEPCVRQAADWLTAHQIRDVEGDWTESSGKAAPGGWAFQYANDHYPDTDDTAAVALALDRTGRAEHHDAVTRAGQWIRAMQSRDGGWGAYDANNDKQYLNHIPFADHGALLDPSSADVTARCAGLLAQLDNGAAADDPALGRAVQYLLAAQEEDGSWFGRWGTNYIYGTWSALSALNAAGMDMDAPAIRRAVDWLVARQREDGGWGEDCATYWPDRKGLAKASTPTQTAWALLALLAAGEVESEAVERGISYLLSAPRTGEAWHEAYHNAVGFPRVFYLKYHGYPRYFPLWALARYRNIKQANRPTTPFGL